jgi:hypothetical protein
MLYEDTTRKERMTIENKIFKINRHLFYYGTSKLNRVLRSFVPRVVGSIPSPLDRIAQLVEQQTITLLKKKNEEQGRNAQTEIEFARQGIPFGQFVQTQLDFPLFWCSSFFLLKTILKNI